MIHRVQKETQWATTDADIPVDFFYQKPNITVAFRHDILASYQLGNNTQIKTFFVPLAVAAHPSM